MLLTEINPNLIDIHLTEITLSCHDFAQFWLRFIFKVFFFYSRTLKFLQVQRSDPTNKKRVAHRHRIHPD